jgi:hypothetical protein
MGTHWGNEGTVKLGANAIAEMDKWEVKTSVTPVNDTSMGDQWETHIPGSGIKNWTGNIECHWDEADANGQVLMVAGASLTFNFYPEGSSSGDVYRTGLGSVIEEGFNVVKDGDTIRASFSILGNGPLTPSTVA